MKSEINQSTPVRAYSPPAEHWFIVRHRTGLRNHILDVTVRQLEAEGYEYYRPMFQRRKRVGTRMEWVSEAIFRDYMFVRPVRPVRLPITSIYGIEGGAVGAVRPAVVNAFKVREVDGFFQFASRLDPASKHIKAGDMVRTLDGLIEALVLHRDDERGRLTLLSHFMNGESELVVSLAHVVRSATAEELAEAKRVLDAEAEKAKPKKVKGMANKTAAVAGAPDAA